MWSERKGRLVGSFEGREKETRMTRAMCDVKASFPSPHGEGRLRERERENKVVVITCHSALGLLDQRETESECVCAWKEKVGKRE